MVEYTQRVVEPASDQTSVQTVIQDTIQVDLTAGRAPQSATVYIQAAGEPVTARVDTVQAR